MRTAALLLWLFVSVAGCSKSQTPAPPPFESPPTHGIRTYTFTVRTDDISKSNVLETFGVFARQHSLPPRGPTQAKGWPSETYGFGYLPCYTNVHLAVGFSDASAQTMVELMYYGTNDSFFEDFHAALQRSVDTNFTGRVVSERKNF
jgi:hypothetical protein